MRFSLAVFAVSLIAALFLAGCATSQHQPLNEYKNIDHEANLIDEVRLRFCDANPLQSGFVGMYRVSVTCGNRTFSVSRRQWRSR